MKPIINYGKRLGMWATFDRIEPGSKVLWELDMIDETDLLLYDKEVTREEIEKDIEECHGKTEGWTLVALTPDEVYNKYLRG